MDFCEDPDIAALLTVKGVVNGNFCDCRKEGQILEFIDMIFIFVSIVLLKEIISMFGHIPFFTSARVLMLLSSTYWQMYRYRASRVLGGGFG